MKEIIQALNDYQAMLDNLKWLQENGQLAPDADIGALAFQGAIYFSPAHVVEAFVAVMEIDKAERERQANKPKRTRSSNSDRAVQESITQQSRKQEMILRAKQLSWELANLE